MSTKIIVHLMYSRIGIGVEFFTQIFINLQDEIGCYSHVYLLVFFKDEYAMFLSREFDCAFYKAQQISIEKIRFY